MDTHAAKIQKSLFLATSEPPKPSAFAPQHLKLQRKDSLRFSPSSTSKSPTISPISPETPPEVSTMLSPKLQQVKRPGLERTNTLKNPVVPRGSIFNPAGMQKRRESEMIPVRRQSRSTTHKLQRMPTVKAKPFEPAPAPEFMHTPSLFKEYKYRKTQNRDSIIKETGNNEQRELKRMSIFSLSAFGSKVTDTRPISPNPSRASRAYRKKMTIIQQLNGSPSPKNPNLLSPLTTPVHRFQQRNSHISNFTETSCSSEDEDLTPEQLRLRKILKRALYTVYFVGVMISFKNKVKVYGALRPIEYLEDFESVKPKTEHKSFLPIIPTSMFSLLWAITIIFCLTLTAVLTPIYISFADDGDMFFYYLNLVMDFGFGIDIVVNLLSAYYDDEKNLVTNWKKIILNYMRMWFWIDIIAVVPIDEIIQSQTSQLNNMQQSHKIFRLLRFPRLYKLFKIIRLLKVTKIFSVSRSFNKLNKKLSLNVLMTKIIRILFNFAFLNHLVGCLWFYVARFEDFSPDSWVGKAGLADADTKTQYIASLYWSFQTLTTVGYGDLAPSTPLERALSSIWILFGVLIYTFTVGNLSALLFGYQMKAESLKEKLVSFERFALKANIPDFLAQKVRRCYEINHKENACHWIDPTDKLKSLPANLKTSLLLYSYYAFIKKIKVLQINANFTAALLVHFKVQKLKPGEIIYRQDDPSDEIYFIVTGSVKFITQRSKGIFSLSEGTYFGELEAFEGTKRLCFCKALHPTVILICPKLDFLKTLEDFPDIEAQMKKIGTARKGKLNEKVGRIQKAEQLETPDPDIKPIAKTTEYINKLLLNIPDPEVRFQKRRRERRLTKPKSTVYDPASITNLQNVQSPEKPPERKKGRKRTFLSRLTPRGYFGMSMEDLDSQVDDEESVMGSSNTLKVPTKVDLGRRKSRFEPKTPIKEAKSPLREPTTMTKINDTSSPSLIMKKTILAGSVDNLLSHETKYQVGSIASEPKDEKMDTLLDQIDVGAASFSSIPKSRDFRGGLDNFDNDVIEELEEVPSPALPRIKIIVEKRKSGEAKEEPKSAVIKKAPSMFGNNLLSLVTGQGLKNLMKPGTKIVPITERSKRKECDTPTRVNNSKNYQKVLITSSESDLDFDKK